MFVRVVSFVIAILFGGMAAGSNAIAQDAPEARAADESLNITTNTEERALACLLYTSPSPRD